MARAGRSGAHVWRRWCTSAKGMGENSTSEYKGLLGMENSHVAYALMACNVGGFLAWHARCANLQAAAVRREAAVYSGKQFCVLAWNEGTT